MSDAGTNFPPQTYSSVFNLNTIGEEAEKNVKQEEEAEARSGSSPMLDCFVSSMDWKYIVIFLSYLSLNQAEEYLTCILDDHPKIRTFQTLVKYQANKLPFNPHEPGYQGNYVNFSVNSIDRLQKNTFLTFSSQNVIGMDLSNKSIKEIDEGAFLFIFCLHYLDLSNNRISNLTKDMFLGLDNLKTLNISENNLNYWYSSAFSHLKSLQVLDISHNNISDLGSYGISTLEKLILSYNSMKRLIYPYFNELSKLKELYIDHNSIALIPTIIFTNNVHLETLDVSGNQLLLFDMFNSTQLSHVKHLNLSDNYLIRLHVENFSYYFPNEELTIDFNNNQFYCGSWEQYLKQFKETHIKLIPGRNFSVEHHVNGIACDTLNYTDSLYADQKDTYPLIPYPPHEIDAKRNESRLNDTLVHVLRQLQHKEGELSSQQTKYITVNAAPDKLPLVRHDDTIAPNNIKEDNTNSGNGAMQGISIALAVVGIVFFVLVTFVYVLGVGFMVKLGKRLRCFLSPSTGDDDNEYLTLTRPS